MRLGNYIRVNGKSGGGFKCLIENHFTGLGVSSVRWCGVVNSTRKYGKRGMDYPNPVRGADST